LRNPVLGVGALVWRRTDHRGQLRFDQRLIDRRGRLTDPFFNISGLECLEDFKQGRLVQSHRVMCPFRENHWRGYR
jgi:hypothetical protein